MLNGIIYNGDVTIKVADLKKHRHNNGSENLFRLLSAFLIGAVCPTRSLPTYLMLYNNHIEVVMEYASDVRALTPAIKNYSPVYSYQEHTVENGYKAVFTSTFTADISGNPVDTENNPYCVALLDATQTQILAAVTVDTEVIVKLSQKYQAMIKWEMSFRNGEVVVDDKDTEE